MTRNSTHCDDAPSREQRLAGWIMRLFLAMMPVHALCLHLVTTTQHTQHPTWKPLLYSVEQLLHVWNVGAIKGATSGIWVWDMDVWCWLLRWYDVHGICILRYFHEHPGYGVLV